MKPSSKLRAPPLDFKRGSNLISIILTLEVKRFFSLSCIPTRVYLVQWYPAGKLSKVALQYVYGNGYNKRKEEGCRFFEET